jgi:hypothetical protein
VVFRGLCNLLLNNYTCFLFELTAGKGGGKLGGGSDGGGGDGDPSSESISSTNQIF